MNLVHHFEAETFCFFLHEGNSVMILPIHDRTVIIRNILNTLDICIVCIIIIHNSLFNVLIRNIIMSQSNKVKQNFPVIHVQLFFFSKILTDYIKIRSSIKRVDFLSRGMNSAQKVCRQERNIIFRQDAIFKIILDGSNCIIQFCFFFFHQEGSCIIS